ncbi:hypothetical protein EDB83DRAFT_290180 [Lactarius deliciosus]|nr:hypothetical protein EDB83DRAFT_290180 [Lactarius deliciosus]
MTSCNCELTSPDDIGSRLCGLASSAVSIRFSLRRTVRVISCWLDVKWNRSAAHMPHHKFRSTDHNPRHEDVMGVFIARATMHTVPSVVSDQVSVGSGKVKGNYIRTLRKVTDEADVVLLVLDLHDDRGRGKLVEEQARGGSRRPHLQRYVLYSSCSHFGSASPLLHRISWRSSCTYELKSLSTQRPDPDFTKTLALISFNFRLLPILLFVPH